MRSHGGRPDGWRVEGRVVVVDVVEGRVGQTWQVNSPVLTTVLVVQQRRHRLPGPHGDQDGVFIFSQLRNKVAATVAIRPSVRFVGLEGLSGLLLYSEPSTPNVYTRIIIPPSSLPPSLTSEVPYYQK